MKSTVNQSVNSALIPLEKWFVGMTGFEPATTRPPGVYATGLRYIPKMNSSNCKISKNKFQIPGPCKASDEWTAVSKSDCKNIKVSQINFYLFKKMPKSNSKLSIHSNSRSVQPLRCASFLAKENPCPPLG